MDISGQIWTKWDCTALEWDYFIQYNLIKERINPGFKGADEQMRIEKIVPPGRIGGNPVECPCCTNKRLLDLSPEYVGRIEIKCPRCSNIIAITSDNTEVRTEQIDVS